MKRPPTLASALARAWFPLALILLLLLFLPGLVLFALNLFGWESSANRWLHEHWSLTYHIPIPWWAGLLLLLVPLLILLLYFLKLKRKPLQVPSTFLWKKSIEDLHVNSLFQWLRENVLLLLQILTVLILIYALMSFQLHGNTTEGKHYIIMIDNSASMSATDVAPMRLDVAKQDALNEINAHTDNDTGMVIVFNSSAAILQSYTHDRSLLRRAVESIQPTQRPTQIEEALSLAESLANPSRSTEDAASRPVGEDPAKARTYVATEGIPTEIHLYSDGRFPDVAEFALGNLSVQYHPIGRMEAEAADNLGLVTLNAVRDDRDPTRVQVFAKVYNYQRKEAETHVQLEVLVNGELRGIYEEPVGQLGAGGNPVLPARKLVRVEEGREDSPLRDQPGEGVATFQISDVDDRSNVILHARLKGVKDSFPLDDEAWLVVGVIRKARILIVTPDNKPLSAFFDHPATQKVANVTYQTPEVLKDRDRYLQPARDGNWDLVLFDRCAPEKEEEMPAANTYFIDAVPPAVRAIERQPLKGPLIKGWLGKHSLLNYLRALHELGIAEAFRLDFKDSRMPPRTPRLLESDADTVLMFTVSRQSFTDLVQTFALVDNEGRFNTTWPLHPSFPLFLRNVTYVLGNVSDAAGEELVQPGKVKTLRPDVPLKRIEVINPKGEAKLLERGTRPEFTYGDTEQVGIYGVRWDGQEQRSFAVNLLDAEESNLEPRGEIKVGDVEIQAGDSRGTPRDTWKWVALAALGLLLLEWYIYNRRVYI
jgi:hypothetical protein